MWEILSIKTGRVHGINHDLNTAIGCVFRGGFFAHDAVRNMVLVLDPRDGRVTTLYL